LSGCLRPGLDPDAPEVRSVLAGWRGARAARPGPFGWELFLFEPAPRRERWALHAVLFLLTVFSTVLAGSLLAGRYPIEFAALTLVRGWWLPIPASLDVVALVDGLPFGIALVTVLALHEAGHYFTARRYGVSVTPPYFIPFPPYVSVIGTLGAFIRLRSPVLGRRALLDVALAGPFLSFVGSLPLIWWGLVHSRVLDAGSAGPGGYLVRFAGERFWLGGSALVSGLVGLFADLPGPQYMVELHPIAFAGWLGLFVTALNLLPISQLDGGHILYALLGRHQRPLAWVFFAALIPLGLLWPGWWVWAVLVFVIGRGRVRHPPLFAEHESLGRAREIAGWAAVLVFLFCFVPVPFRI
jgi:membrane-associated protease RseP (regulator of RpoE activity)